MNKKIIVFSVTLIAFCFVAVSIASTSEQLKYDVSVDRYNELVFLTIEAKQNLLFSEKKLAESKIKESINDVHEIQRLTAKIIKLNEEIEKINGKNIVINFEKAL